MYRYYTWRSRKKQYVGLKTRVSGARDGYRSGNRRRRRRRGY